MSFELLYVIFVVVTVLNYIFLDIKIDKMKMEIIEKDKLITAFEALDKSIKKLNDAFKDHERRIDNIEELSLSEKTEKPEEHEYTCEDCKYYHPFNSIGFADAVNYFECEKTGRCFSRKEIGTCRLFEKKESLDKDENVFYVNNVGFNISSENPYDEAVGRITKLYLDGV